MRIYGCAKLATPGPVRSLKLCKKLGPWLCTLIGDHLSVEVNAVVKNVVQLLGVEKWGPPKSLARKKILHGYTPPSPFHLPTLIHHPFTSIIFP